nr:hypothetical protein [Steroidobacter sp.]
MPFDFNASALVRTGGGVHRKTPVEMARAALIGQPVHLLSPLVPSTYLLVGLADVEFGDHQRYTLKWAVAICLLLMATALLFGIFPLVAG